MPSAPHTPHTVTTLCRHCPCDVRATIRRFGEHFQDWTQPPLEKGQPTRIVVYEVAHREFATPKLPLMDFVNLLISLFASNFYKWLFIFFCFLFLWTSKLSPHLLEPPQCTWAFSELVILWDSPSVYLLYHRKKLLKRFWGKGRGLPAPCYQFAFAGTNKTSEYLGRAQHVLLYFASQLRAVRSRRRLKMFLPWIKFESR